MSVIRYSEQTIDQDDIDAVVHCLKSDFLTSGPMVAQFERELALYVGVEYSVAVSNATAGLHLACLALGLTEGDVLWTTPLSFVASANCGRYCGADIDFVDIDPNTLNLSSTALESKLKITPKNKLPKVLVVVHFAGQSCEMRKIKELADCYGFRIIEDASHALGAQWENRKVGGCQYSDCCIFSFHPVKPITTGEGGAIVTNNPELFSKLQSLRSHGIVREPSILTQPTEGGWFYEQQELGFNYRITDIQCALGCSQLRKIEQFTQARNERAVYYNQALRSLPIMQLEILPDAYCAYHLYPIQLDLKRVLKGRKQLYDLFHKNGVLVNVHYIPIHLQPYYQKQGFRKGDFPNAEKYYDSALTLPLYPRLSIESQDRIIAYLREWLC